MKKLVTILFTMFLAISLYAQSADVTSDILTTDEVTFGQVCYLSAVQQGLISDDTSYADAISVLVDIGQIPNTVLYEEDQVIPIINIAFIMSEMWNIHGGLMYRITKGSPRYAFKQFKLDKILEPGVEPHDYISGETLFSMYTKCLNVYGSFDISSVSMESE